MTLAEFARERGLKRIGARPPILQYLKQAWQRRQFALTMSVFSNQAANARNILGSWWVILLPTIQAATFGLIFGVILGDARPDNFIPFLFTGVFLFTFFSNSFSNGASSVTNNAGLVRSLSFPRILLPISSVIRQFLNLLPQLLVMFAILLIYSEPITLEWLLFIPILISMTCFSLGLAMISARLTVHVRDLSKLIPFITRILFYTSGVFFEVERILGSTPVLLQIASLNPVYQFLTLARGVLMDGRETSAFLWIASSIWAVGTLLIGLFFFWRAEERYGRE